MRFEKRSTPLDDILAALDGQCNELARARHKYLSKESERKHFEARLIKAQEGKSMNERTINAQATEEWVEFQKELSRLESIFEFQKLKYEILDKEFLAQYATMKLDEGMIKKQQG